MSDWRACDVCRNTKLDGLGRPAVHRYGLSRQIYIDGGRAKRVFGYGGIDLCDDCWKKIGFPRTRPELRGRTGPRRAA